jgi:DNA-binding PadR family transcriptional regulator
LFIQRRKSLLKEAASHKRTGYIKRDNKMLNVARFLNSRPEKGARVTDALNELQKIYWVTQDYNDIQEIMIEMCKAKWTTEDIHGRTKIYKITNAGKEAVHKALDLVQTNHPLGNLDAFKGLAG